VLQRVAACCSVLQRAVACCRALQGVAVCFCALQCVAVRSSVKFGLLVCCGVTNTMKESNKNKIQVVPSKAVRDQFYYVFSLSIVLSLASLMV